MFKKIFVVCIILASVFLQPVIMADYSSLQNLEINSGVPRELSPQFSSTVYGYTATVPADFDWVDVTPTAEDSGATITVNGTSVQSGQSINVSLGAKGSVTTITVVVTGTDSSQQTYTIDVTRLDGGCALLSSLSVQGRLAGLIPNFDSFTFSYITALGFEMTSIDVTPTAIDPTATITVNGDTVSSGSTSTVTISEQTTLVTIVVTNGDPQNQNTYNITVIKQPTGSIAVNNGNQYTNSTTVTLNLSATANATSMRFSNSDVGLASAIWEPYSTTRSGWVLDNSTNGNKTVWVQFRDDNTVCDSPYYSDTIYLDTTTPTGTISIANGAKYVLSTSVILNLSATDTGSGVASMRFGNTYTEMLGNSWETYATSKLWTLSSGDGTKLVYAQFQDRAGNVTLATDTIFLDANGPECDIKINGDATDTNTTAVTLNLLVTDNAGSGVSMMRFSNDSGVTWSDWEIYLTRSRSWTLPAGNGLKTVRVQFRDNLGNTSWDEDSITLSSTSSPQFVTGNAFVFSSNVTGNSEIYVMNENGTSSKNISNYPSAADVEPDWSRDQRKMVFVSDRTGNNDIFIMNMNADWTGSDAINLTNYPDANDHSPVISPNGKYIAFVSNRAGSNREDIFLINADGTGTPINLTNCGDGYFAGNPSWSPNSDRLAFDYTNGGIGSIYTMNLGGQKTARIMGTDTASYSQPSWSPVGTEIALIRNYGGVKQLFTISSQGTSYSRSVTTNTLQKDHPTWSPDGAQIGFTANNCTYRVNVRDGVVTQLTSTYSDVQPSWAGISSWLTGVAFASGGDIYVTNADRYSRITNTTTVEEMEPQLSPVNHQLVLYITYNSGTAIYSLQTLNVGNGSITTITSSSDHLTTPAWSPDGSRIAYSSGWASVYNIIRINSDGTGRTQLTEQVNNDNAGPSWSPDGTQIAFSSNRLSDPEIYTMTADGFSETKFTTTSTGQAFGPKWSPVGNVIAYCTNERGSSSYDIYTENVVSPRNKTRITFSSLYSCHPLFWSPNSLNIIFTSYTSVYVIHASFDETPYVLPVFSVDNL